MGREKPSLWLRSAGADTAWACDRKSCGLLRRHAGEVTANELTTVSSGGGGGDAAGGGLRDASTALYFYLFLATRDSLQQLRGFVLTGPEPSCPGWIDACQFVQPLQGRFDLHHSEEKRQPWLPKKSSSPQSS